MVRFSLSVCTYYFTVLFSQVTQWFKKNHSQIDEHVKKFKPDVNPRSEWWIVLMAINTISQEATNTFRALEGLTTLVSQQREGLNNLAATYSAWFEIETVPEKNPTI